MPPAGLSFSNPLLEAMDLSKGQQPVDPSTINLGVPQLDSGVLDNAVYGAALVEQFSPKPTGPAKPTGPTVAFSPSQNKLFVNGLLFEADDAATALKSKEYLGRPAAAPPPGTDWTPISPETFGAYINSIEHPSAGRLFKKNFGRGVDSLQQLAGGALALAGADKLGTGIMAQQEADLAKTAPFNRDVMDIRTGGDAVDWFVANLGQVGPSILEAAITGSAGFLLGTATGGGPLAGAAGAVAGVIGKKAFKEAVLSAAAKRAAGQQLSAAEARTLGMATSAAVLAANNLVIGSGDNYSEALQQGADPDALTRLAALAGAVPYAALELFPELLLAGRLLGHVAAPKGNMLRRVGKGATIGALSEGGTELGQELVNTGVGALTGTKGYTSDELLSRYINSFAAGFAVGGPIGGLANLRGNKEANLLSPPPAAEPDADGQGNLGLPPGAAGPRLGLDGQPLPNAAAGGDNTALIAQRDSLLDEHRRIEQFVADANTALQSNRLTSEQMQHVAGQVRQARAALAKIEEQLPAFGGLPPRSAAFAEQVGSQPTILAAQPAQMPDQGQLNLSAPAPAVAQPSVQYGLDLPGVPQQTPVVVGQDTRGGVDPALLSGAGAYPGVVNIPPFDIGKQLGAEGTTPDTALALALKQALEEKQAAQLDTQAAATQQTEQRAAQDALAKRNRLAQISQSLKGRNPLVAEPTAAPKMEVVTPEEALGPIPRPEPRQLDLFRGKVKLPQPTKAQQREARRGNKLAQKQEAARQQAEAKLAATADRRQGELFTLKGEPTMAALKGAGVRRALQAPKLEVGATQRPSTNRAKELVPKLEAQRKAAVAAKIAAAEKPKPAKAAKLVMSGFPKAAGVKSVVKAKDNATAGGYVVTLDSGKKHEIYYDQQTQTWRDRNADTSAPFSRDDDILGYSKAEALAKLTTPPKPEPTPPSKGSELKKGRKPAAEKATEAVATKASPAPKAEAAPTPQAQLAKLTPAVARIVNKQAQIDALVNANLADSIEEMDTTRDRDIFEAAAHNVVAIAYFETDNTKQTQQALDYLRNTTFTAAQRDTINQRFVEISHGEELSATYPSTTAAHKKGDPRPWFTYAVQQELLEAIAARGRATIVDAPDWYKAGFAPPPAARLTPAKQKDTKDTKTLHEQIEESLKQVGQPNSKGKFARVAGGTAVPVPLGRLYFVVKSFVAKLRVKPTTHIFRDIADMKAKNPALYARAITGHTQSEFDATEAAGLSVGKEVVLFSDFIRDEAHARTILAHEVLGHYGFAAVLGRQELLAELGRIYAADPNIKSRADVYMEAYGIDRSDAIEEALADYAVLVDSSIIQRLWFALKNALNKLGVTFSDDNARYLVAQSRRYLRTGDTNVLSPGQFRARMVELDNSTRGALFALADDRVGTHKVMIAGAAAARNNTFTQSVFATIDMLRRGSPQPGKTLSSRFSSALENIQTLDNLADKSYGLQLLYDVFQNSVRLVSKLMTKYHSMMTETNRFHGGLSRTQKDEVGRLLAWASNYRLNTMKDSELDKYAELAKVDASGDFIPNNALIAKLKEAGFVTANEFRKGFSFDITGEDGVLSTYTVPPQKIDETSGVWKSYVENRNVVAEAEIDRFMYALRGLQARRNSMLNSFKHLDGASTLDGSDLQVFRRIMQEYSRLKAEGATIIDDTGSDTTAVTTTEAADKRADEFLYEALRAIHEKLKVEDWQTGTEGTASFQSDEFKDIIAALPALNKKFEGNAKAESIAKAIYHAISESYLHEALVQAEGRKTTRTILSSYAPFTRRGTHQVRIEARDADGNTVALSEDDKKLRAYHQFFGRTLAADTADKYNALFAERGAVSVKDMDGKTVKVTMVAMVEPIQTSSSAPRSIDFATMSAMMTRAGIHPDTKQNEALVRIMFNADSKARHNLQRTGNEGWDRDIIRNIAEHVDRAAHLSAKNMYQHEVADIVTDRRNWFGDPTRLKRMRDAITNASTEDGKRIAERAYNRYALQYMHSRSAGTVELGNISVGKGKMHDTLGHGGRYLNDANELMSWYEQNADIKAGPEDFLSGDAASKLRLGIVMAQLGGSIATAAVNSVSLVTNALPYLSTLNSERGAGGGFGFSTVTAELFGNLAALGNHRLGDSEYAAEVAKSRSLQKKYGLSQAEASFLHDATDQGILMPQQMNALAGRARGGIQNAAVIKAIETWMLPFSYTEQLNRRVTAITSYRLERGRAIASGLSEAEADAIARHEAAKAVDKTQGDYGRYNHAKWSRGNFMQYVFMYKLFPTMTIQLLRAMPASGRLMFLATMFMAAGLKGLPGGDDTMDLIDTLAQKFGFKMASVEATARLWLEEVLPGSSSYVMHGVLDTLTGTTVSSRLGLGDLVPLSGIGKAGAEWAREAQNFIGPIYSGLTGSATLAVGLVANTFEGVGLKDDTTTVGGAFRQSSISAFRALADTVSYWQDGSVTNAYNRVVSKEATPWVMFTRLLGFYPVAASQQNDVVRLGKQIGEYAKQVKAEYVQAYAAAKIAGDTGRMQDIRDLVRDWNDGAKGGPYYIRNFSAAANRAAREASKPTAVRYLKTAPREVRNQAKDLLNSLGYDNSGL